MVHQRYGRTDRQTERRTEGRLSVAIPRFALRASGGKNCSQKSKLGSYRFVPKRRQHAPNHIKFQRFSRVIHPPDLIGIEVRGDREGIDFGSFDDILYMPLPPTVFWTL